MSKQCEVAAVKKSLRKPLSGLYAESGHAMPRLLLAKGDAHGYCFIERYKQASFNR